MELNVARRAGARIAVIGSTDAEGPARSFLRAELSDVRFLSLETAAAGLGDVDMLVFVVDVAETIDDERTGALAEHAREHGILVAAIVFDPGRRVGRSPLLAALRDAADMVMIVRNPADVQAVVAALR